MTIQQKIQKEMEKRGIKRIEVVAGELDCSFATLNNIMKGMSPSAKMQLKLDAWLKKEEK